MRVTALEESNRQFIEAWNLFARRSERGVTRESDGIAIAFSNVAMPLMNMVFLSSPVRDRGDLERRLDHAVAAGQAIGRGWIFTICEDWLPPEVLAEAPAMLAAMSLAPMSSATGMVSDELLPPRRPAPPALGIRPTDREAARRHLAELNATAYEMPIEWGHEAMAREALFATDVWGDVGYVGNAAVSTATTALIERRLYVMMVATAAGEMTKGYAEAVMRHSLARAAAATGVGRTVLHATPAGRPLYASMGYRATSEFTMYMLGAAAH